MLTFSPTDDRSYLERCIVITSTALLTSKYKYQLRILVSNILRLLAAPSLSLIHYRTFGVKNVQFDTLSHLVVARGSTFAIENVGKEGGVFEAAVETEKWYRSGTKEAQEMVVKALTHGSFSKVHLLPSYLPHGC
jgi:N-terminal acetyltransferase B complex non-catalytic subunit